MLDVDFLRSKMAQLRLSRQVLARVADVREGDLGLALRGTQPLPNERMQHLNKILADLLEIKSIIEKENYELPIGNPAKLRTLLQRFHEDDTVPVPNIVPSHADGAGDVRI